jgi:hypothetical protein
MDRIDSNHPAAPPELQTGRYWSITPDGSGTADLTLPTAFAADLADGVCRYTGSDWDCARTSNTAHSVTRNGVTTFSEWAVTNQTVGVFKTVTPETNVPYHGVVTYTLVLANGAASDTSAVLTDTLPAGVTFGQWIERPTSGLIRNGNAITWTGTLTASTAITFTFTATHTGDYGDVIKNTAYFSGTLGKDSDNAVFSVECLDAVTVKNANDSGPGSLRQAIADVCPEGPIDFASSLAGRTITLSRTLDLAKNLTIDGSRLAAPVEISGNGAVRVFRVASNAQVTLENLTMRNGNAGGGDGGCIISSGVLTLTNSTVKNCQDTPRGGGIFNAAGGTARLITITVENNASTWNGGGISNFGVMTLMNSRIVSNTARTNSGGIGNFGVMTVTNSTIISNTIFTTYQGGGVINAEGGTLTLNNSTISGNSTSGNTPGGGLASVVGATTILNNCTLSGNSARSGGGVFVDSGSVSVINATIVNNTAVNTSTSGIQLTGGTLSLGNSIVANNSVTNNLAISGGVFTSLGYNLTNSSAGTPFAATTDLTNTDPLLGPLQDNGGPSASSGTWTHALLPGSPAIDAIPVASCTLATDQRGVSRPQPAGGNCDIGAFESYGYMIFLPVVLRNP